MREARLAQHFPGFGREKGSSTSLRWNVLESRRISLVWYHSGLDQMTAGSTAASFDLPFESHAKNSKPITKEKHEKQRDR